MTSHWIRLTLRIAYHATDTVKFLHNLAEYIKTRVGIEFAMKVREINNSLIVSMGDS